MFNECLEATIQKCIEMLQEPGDQIKAANRLIGLCMAMRTERRPTELVAVPSLLGEELEALLIKHLYHVAPLVRRKLTFVLGELGGQWEDEAVPQTVRILAQIVQEDSNSDVRAAAVDALGKLGGLAAVKALEESAKQDPVSTIRARALFALDHLSSRSDQEILDTAPIDQFLAEMTRVGIPDTITVARELILRREGGRAYDYAERFST